MMSSIKPINNELIQFNQTNSLEMDSYSSFDHIENILTLFVSPMSRF